MAKPRKNSLVPGLETLCSLIAAGVLALIPLDPPVYAIISVILLGLMGHVAWRLVEKVGGNQIHHRAIASGLSALALGVLLAWGAWARFSVHPDPTPTPSPTVTVTNSPGSLVAPSGGTNSVTNNFATPSRRLVGDQRALFVASAKSFCGPTVHVDVTGANSNNEALVYGSDFVNALIEAGCKADLALPIPGLRPDVSGIVIGFRSSVKLESDLPPNARSLHQALNSAMVSHVYQAMEDNFFPDDQFVLAIGASP